MNILLNLLPPAEKEEIKNLKRIGVILKIGFAAVCAVAVFLVFLFFIMQTILIQEEAVTKEIARFEQSESYQEVKRSQDSLRDYSKTASKVKSGLSSQNHFWEMISQINQIVPEDIKMVELSVNEEGILTLNGIAYTREALLVLKKGLEDCEKISKVESPISNFVAEKDVEFEFTANID